MSDDDIKISPLKPDTSGAAPMQWKNYSGNGGGVSLWNSDYKALFFKKEPDIQIPFRPASERTFELFPLADILRARDIEMSGNIEAVIESLSQNYNKNFNVTTTLFKGKAADLDKYLEGTKMAGKGAAFLEAQEKYGVNALFLMAITQAESGYGNAPARDKRGIKPYNVAGLKKAGGGYQNNASYEACIDSLGSSLKRLYFRSGKVTVEKIRKTFCPGNPKWTAKVVNEMKNISSHILKNYCE